jgi:hypothetical protein
MSRVDELKQRLQKVAYKGMVNRRGPQSYEEAMKGSHSDTMANTIQKGFNEEETRKNILDRIDPTELPHKQEVTCGASSEHCLEHWENVVEDGNIGGIEKIKGVGGIYTGPGAEHSLKRLNLKSNKKEVGHAWLELPDKTIIDASAGQFIDQKHEPLKQRQRFRIIPKESGLHKYYKKDPLLTHHLHMDDPQRQITRKLRKQGIDPFPSRKAKLKQRLALEGGVGGVRKYWLYPDGKISEDVRWHDKLHFNDEGQMRDKGGVKITNEQGKYDNYFGVGLRQHLTPAQKSHIKQELKDYGFYRNKGNVTFDHGDNKNNTVDSTTKDFGDGFAHSYEHNQKPIGSQKISKLKQRLSRLQQ